MKYCKDCINYFHSTDLGGHDSDLCVRYSENMVHGWINVYRDCLIERQSGTCGTHGVLFVQKPKPEPNLWERIKKLWKNH